VPLAVAGCGALAWGAGAIRKKWIEQTRRKLLALQAKRGLAAGAGDTRIEAMLGIAGERGAVHY
jgi:hypothetical protein